MFCDIFIFYVVSIISSP